MAGRQAPCPECGASIEVHGYEDGDPLYCPDCGEELKLVDDTGGFRPELVLND